MWGNVKRWFRIDEKELQELGEKLKQLGKEIGLRLLREDCRHCKGTGRCHSGLSESYSISCASCQKAAMGEVRTHLVRCEPCNGRGIFVFAVPNNEQLEKLTLEVLPRVEGEWSIIQVRPVQADPSRQDQPALPDPEDFRDE